MKLQENFGWTGEAKRFFSYHSWKNLLCGRFFYNFKRRIERVATATPQAHGHPRGITLHRHVDSWEESSGEGNWEDID